MIAHVFYLVYFFPPQKILDLVSPVFLPRALILHGGGGGLLLFESGWVTCTENEGAVLEQGLALPPLPGVDLQHDDTTTLCNMQEKAHS